MKYKSDIVQVFSDFFAYVNTHFHTPIMNVRSDNAKEICEGPLKLFFAQHGIFHQTSCTETPQQNGVVERRHRHLLETARDLYFQSKVPVRFWGECILCASYLINRMPLQVLQFSSPFEKLFGHKPDVSHLRVFGCLCFTSTLKQGRYKFEPRLDPCVFMGYSITQKGYRVLNLQTNKILISRDVIFYEKYLPYHSSHTNPTPLVAPIFLPLSTPTSSFYDDDIPDVFHTSIPSTSDLHDPPISSNDSPPSSSPSLFSPLSQSSLHDISSTLSFTPPVRRSTRLPVPNRQF